MGILGEMFISWHFQSVGSPSPAVSPKIEQDTATFVCHVVTSAAECTCSLTSWDTNKITSFMAAIKTPAMAAMVVVYGSQGY